jgi:hypothetical protein
MTQDEKRPREDQLIKARRQLRSATNEFQRRVSAVKDPVRRKRLTNAYVELLQKNLTKAQQALTKYQDKNAEHPKPGTPDQARLP